MESQVRNPLKSNLKYVLACALALLALVVIPAAATARRAAEPAPAAARQDSPVVILLDGTVRRGDNDIPLSADVRLNPGEVITWRMKATNNGSRPAMNVQAAGQLDALTAYVPASAGGGGVRAVEFALAGGAFSARPVVRVVEGGVERLKPAPVEDYRMVRFTFDSIAPGASVVATYQARVR